MKAKNTSILFLLLLSLIGGAAFAQVQINAPLSYQPSNLEQGGALGTYKVDIINNTGAALSGATFSLVLPTGLEYVAGTITAATQANVSNLQSPTFTLNSIPVGNTLVVTFNARINCGYSTSLITYNVLQGATPLATATSAVAANTPSPAYVLTAVPTPQVLNTPLKTNALRTIKFKNSGNVSVSTVYIESTVATASQYSSYKVMSANNGTVSAVTNGYRLTLTGAALQAAITTTVGAANMSFDAGEEITVVLTEQMLSCAQTTSIALNMKAGSGDTKGSFCFSDGSTAAISTTVGNPSIDFNRIVATGTYPTFCTDGKTSYTIKNSGNGGTESALHDIKLPWSVYRASSGQIATNTPVDGIILKKVSIGGVDVTSLVLQNNGTGSGALIPAAQNVKVINLAALTSAPGGVSLVDLDGDGHFDDLMPGQTFQIDFEYGFDLSKFQSCMLQSAITNGDGNGYFSLGTSFKNQCGIAVNKFDYSYVASITSTGQSFLIANQALNLNSATIDKALFNLGDKSNIVVTMMSNISGAFYNGAVPITKKFTFVMPDGLDYDPTGVLKFGTNILPASVAIYTGKTLTITLSSVTYTYIRTNDAITVPVIANSNTAISKTINYKATYSQNNCPGISRDYGCGSTALNYGFFTNCPTVNTTGFSAVRTTYGFVPDASGNNVFYRPTAFVNENTPGINLQGAVSKDKIRFNINGAVNSATFSQLWARIKYTPVGVAANLSHFDPLSVNASTVIGVLKVKNVSDGSTLNTNITVGDVVFSYDSANLLQIMQVNVGAKIGSGLAINYNLAVGDEISIDWQVTASRDNLPWTYSAISNLQGEFYTKDSGNIESSCTPLPGILYLQRLTKGQSNYYGVLNIAGDQTLGIQMGMVNNNDNTNSAIDKFPNEVREYSNIRSATATVPGTWVIDPSILPAYSASVVGSYLLNPSMFTITYVGGNTVINFTNAAFGVNGLPDPASNLPANDYVVNNGVERVYIYMKPICVPTGAVTVKTDMSIDNYTTGPDLSNVENATNTITTGGISYVSYAANSTPTLQNVDGIGSIVNWQVKVTNTTDIAAMAATGLSTALPNNWMSFVSANNNITVTKLVDISTGIEYPTINYGTGKYWVKLGNIATTATYNVVATYTTCTNDKLHYTYSFGASGYPIDPDSGFGGSVTTCASSQSSADLNLFPKDVSIGMLVTSPLSPVQFCTNTTPGENPINYTMTVTNTGSGNSEGLIMQALFPEAYGAKSGTSKLTYNGTTKTISDPVLNTTTGLYEWKISTDPNGIPFLPGAG
ncbi:hypothetical protein PQ462_14700 [Flavobacterium sp. KACC 22758]|uniref:hypothetical protein n=1 Tax=Flavobacterium sp. KACC 22758 TaxID=3025667 RepID=UPI0023662AE2|nr:hypothetical protein [Flavobacterium sp. KACC 22758]WDF57969.1 hypothetical protein PQ462_14700 [Flavobacterium sp. KACC 22758]